MNKATLIPLLFLAPSLGAEQSAKSPSAQQGSGQEIKGESHFAKRDGQRIHIWEKAPLDWATQPTSQRRAVVFVHGATYSGRPDFDLNIRDYSVMESFARAGWDTFAVDAQGYGASDDPLEESWCHARDAAKDLQAAIEYICELRGLEQVSLFGWSWGVQVAGEYAQAHPERVAKLVLQGGTYRTKFDIPTFTERFRMSTQEGAGSDFVEGCYEQDVKQFYVEECLKHDASSPNGSLLDFAKGSDQILQPAKLSMPTLIILGEHETTPQRLADLSDFFVELATPHKRLMVMPGGGHAILLEKPHRRWQREIRRFFEESWQ